MCSSEMLFTFCVIFCGPLGKSLPLPCLFWAAGSDVIDKCLLDDFTEAVIIKNKLFFCGFIQCKDKEGFGVVSAAFQQIPTGTERDLQE